jgi:hypothetical protein
LSVVAIPARPDARVLSMKSVRQQVQIATFEC